MSATNFADEIEAVNAGIIHSAEEPIPEEFDLAELDYMETSLFYNKAYQILNTVFKDEFMKTEKYTELI